MGQELENTRALFMHLTLVPVLKASGEIKTKPTQHSVKELRSIGIHPDILVCRTEHEISDSIKRKLALGFMLIVSLVAIVGSVCLYQLNQIAKPLKYDIPETVKLIFLL